MVKQRGKASDKVALRGKANDKVALQAPQMSGDEIRASLVSLEKEMSSMRGRDAKDVSADCKQLVEQIKGKNARISASERKTLLKKVKDLDEEASQEHNMEKACEKWLSRGCTFYFVGPALITFLGVMAEFATRPPMLVDHSVSMAGQHVIVTGGCDGMGFETASMLARAGADVVVGCRGDFDRLTEVEQRYNFDPIEANDVDAGGFEDEIEDDEDEDIYMSGRLRAWSLDLASFDSVVEFAQQYVDDYDGLGPHVLIHNAGTALACNLTKDGHEITFQTNYLSPFLLTQLLLPGMKRNLPGRVVHVTCDAALTETDWLPWPLTRTTPAKLPKIDVGNLNSSAHEERGCDPQLAYANSKLAVLIHSNELNRRLGGTPIFYEGATQLSLVSNAVNPGATATSFVEKGSPPKPSRVSLRRKIFSYFPPFWLMGKIVSTGYMTIHDGMLRSVETGASAQFHVATSPALSNVGGALFSDKSTVFTGCGLPADRCGVTPVPPSVDEEVTAARLWKASMRLTRSHRRPLVAATGNGL